MIAALIALLAVVNSPVNSVTYACDGATAAYTVNFPYLASSDLVVTSTAANGSVLTLVQGTDWTVNLSSTSSTASLTLNSPATKCASGSTFKIARNTGPTQPTSFRQQNNYDPRVHETAYDRATMLIQEGLKGVTIPLSGAGTALSPLVMPKADTSHSGFLSAADWNAFSAGPVGSSTYTGPFAGAVARLISGKLADSLSVVDAGTHADGTDDAPKIQNAINAAVAGGNGRVYLPCGTYTINSAISLTPTFFGISIEGANKNCVTVKAGAAMTAVFLYTDAGANGRFQFRNLTIDGNSLAQYGIFSAQFRYGELIDLTVQGAIAAGVQFSAGWDITVRNSEFVNNTGDGFILADSQGNDLSFDKTLFTSNGGCGARFVGGGPIVVRSGAVQGNAKCGLYFVGLGRPGVVDAVYFEANAATGIAFTTPVKTVKADVISNGVSLAQAETNLNASNPSPNITVRNCLFNETSTEAAIYAVAGTSMSLRGNFNSGPTVPLLKTYGSRTFANVSNVELAGNVGFSKDFDVDSITNQSSQSYSTWISDSVSQRVNYFPRSVYAISKVGVSSGTSVLKRGTAKYRGDETFDVDQGAGDTYGVTLDVTANPELAGAFIYISAWAKSSAVAAGPRLGIGAKVNTGSFAGDLLWHHVELADFAPGAGTVIVGFSKLGAVLGDIVTFSKVTVAVVGVPDRVLQPDITTMVRWATTAAPTTGTWSQGDLVWNSTPAAAGPPGWVCTAGGAPGTWKAMANVAP